MNGAKMKSSLATGAMTPTGNGTTGAMTGEGISTGTTGNTSNSARIGTSIFPAVVALVAISW